MKQKITILALLFTIFTFSQVIEHNTRVLLTNVNTGVVSDSLLVIAPNDEVRKIPRSVFLQGVEVDLSDYFTKTETSYLLANYAAGDHTTNANELADGSVSDNEFQYINSLTSNAQGQIDNKANKLSTFNKVDATATFTGTGTDQDQNGYGSTGFPSPYGSYVHFGFGSSSGRAFTLWKNSSTARLYWQSYDDNTGASNGFKELYHSGNFNPAEFKTSNWTFKQVGNDIEMPFNGVTKTRFKSDGSIEATDLIGNWNGKEVSDFEPAMTFSSSPGTLSDSKNSYMNLDYGSSSTLTIPTGITKRKWLISTTGQIINFTASPGVTINVIANGRSTSLAIGDEDSIGQSATLIRVGGDEYNLIK